MPRPDASPKPESRPHGDTVWSGICVAASSQRTLKLHTRDDGTLCLRKVFETGSAESAEREADTLRQLAHGGFPRVFGTATDNASGRPCLDLEWIDALDLENDVAAHGPMTPRQAAALGAALAARLAALHEGEGGHPAAVHGDIKPANVVGIGLRDESDPGDARLLDGEHAVLVANAQGHQGFTGGTHGYAPPEARLGAAPHPGFDVFGLGALLVFALTGTATSHGLRLGTATPADSENAAKGPSTAFLPPPPQPAAIARRLGGLSDAWLRVLLGCLDPNPKTRMDAGDAAAQLRQIANAEPTPLDQAWTALLRGDASTAAGFLTNADPTPGPDAKPDESERTEWLSRRLRRQRKVQARWPTVQHWLDHGATQAGHPKVEEQIPSSSQSDQPTDEASQPAATMVAQDMASQGAQLRGINRWLRRFPGDPQAIAQREARRDAAVPSLLQAPELASLARAATEFRTAREILHHAIELREACGMGPGTFPSRDHLTQPRSDESTPTEPQVHPVLRDGMRTLRSALEATKLEAAEFRARIRELEQAECALDRQAAHRAIAALTENHGGAVQAVAKLRDREHRFRYALERFSASRETLRALRTLPEFDSAEVPTEALAEFLDRAAKATQSRRAREDMAAHPRSPAGLRTLAREIEEFVTEFPHVGATVAEPQRQCNALLGFTSHVAWTVLKDAEAMLEVHPVPLRPLHNALHRLDTFVHGELLGDALAPERSRSAFFDALETVRRRVDQARATRDRIAHGAQEAMARGHWTTALYDMQRAVEQLPHDDDSSQQLVEELEQAREKKERLEQAKLDNVRLASEIAQRAAEPHHDREALRQMLDERADALELMVRLLPDGSAQRFRDDLTAVRQRIIEDRVSATEAAMARAGQDLAKQRDLVDDLLLILTTTDADQEGERRTAVSTWRNKRDHFDMLLTARAKAQAEQAQKARRNRGLAAVAAVVVLGSALAWFISTRQPVHASPDGEGASAVALDFEVIRPSLSDSEELRIKFDEARVESREANAWATLSDGARSGDTFRQARAALLASAPRGSTAASEALERLLEDLAPTLENDATPQELAWARAALRLVALRAAESAAADSGRRQALRVQLEAAHRNASLQDLASALR